jgi:1,4-dihydroxy-2-naphthoate octaprenyltransferase
MMSNLNAAEIEQTKLLANAFDRTSTACITVGVVTPVAAILYGFGSNAIQFGLVATGYFIGWLTIAVALHYMARRILRKLR